MHHFHILRRGLLLAATVTAALAHPMLLPAEVPANGYTRLAIVITHGCEGSATREVSIALPESITAAKPYAKSGWQSTIVQSPLDKPRSQHGKTITTRVSEISWAGDKLPDNEVDEFALLIKAPASAGTVPLKVTQRCEAGETAWVEPVVDATNPPAHPTALLRVVDAPAPGHAH